MNSNNLKNENNIEIEEEDYSNFFLQPVLCPYNITEKIQQANLDLFNDDNCKLTKSSKVQFKEELISYEPDDLTDDDVNSIESDPPISDNDSNLQILEYKTKDLNIFDIDEEPEEMINDRDVEVEEIIEEIPLDQDCIDNIKCGSIVLNNETTYRKDEEILVPKKMKKKQIKASKPFYLNQLIDCKTQCIEKLDFDHSILIKKLEIHEKPICPLLKLHQRTCCDLNKTRYPQILPYYNGHNSEYGLSESALKKRQKLKELSKIKEEKQKELLEKYRTRKIEQNETVFCQWLKDVAKRKQKVDKITNRQCFSPNVISLPLGKNKERPKTANQFVPKQNIKRAKRPHTSPCVLIEVPRRFLKKGIVLGDLLMTTGNFSDKQKHILSVS